MTKRLAVLAAACAVAIGGCGGEDEESASPLGEALAYFPQDAATVAVLETAPGSQQWTQVDDLIERFAIAPQIRQQGKERIARGPLDFDRDLRPQLGNELVVGMPDPKAGKRGYLMTLKVKSPTAARGELTPKLKQAGLESRLDGDVLVAAPTRALVDAAIRQKDEDDKLTEERFDASLGRLSEGEPLLRATGDLEQGIDAKRLGQAAEALPWLGALRRYAVAGKAQPDGLALDFEVTTEQVKDADLPLATGPASPPVPQREGEIAVAAREPGRPAALINRLREFLPRTKAHSKALNDSLDKIGVDLERDLLDQMGSVGAASFPLDKTYVARAELKDPDRFAQTLKTLSERLAGAAAGDVGFTIEPGGGEGFYRLNADRGRQIFVGVVDDQVAVGEEAGRARDFAEEKAVPVPGARGSLVFAADAETLANAIIEDRASGALALLGQLATQPLGPLRGWAETKPTGMTGHAELKIE